MITAPYFLATKMEAFLTRGNSDYYGSHDLEDMIAVIDGRPEILDEIYNENDDLKKYLAEKFGFLNQDSAFMEAIPCHLPPDQASQDRASIITKRLRQIIEAGTNT